MHSQRRELENVSKDWKASGSWYRVQFVIAPEQHTGKNGPKKRYNDLCLSERHGVSAEMHHYVDLLLSMERIQADDQI